MLLRLFRLNQQSILGCSSIKAAIQKPSGIIYRRLTVLAVLNNDARWINCHVCQGNGTQLSQRICNVGVLTPWSYLQKRNKGKKKWKDEVSFIEKK